MNCYLTKKIILSDNILCFCHFLDRCLSGKAWIHSLLTKELGINRNLRHRRVGITGTNYRPLDNEVIRKKRRRKELKKEKPRS